MTTQQIQHQMKHQTKHQTTHVTKWIALALGAIAAPALADPPGIDVGAFVLAPETAGQRVEIAVTGGDPVTGFNLRAQLGDGLGAGDEPIFEAIDFTGSIFDTQANAVFGGPIAGVEQFAQASITFSQSGIDTPASGLVATLVIDTRGVPAGTYPIALAATDIGVDSDFIGFSGATIPATITNGTVTIAGCIADVTNTGTCDPATTDGVADLSDFSCFLALWANADPLTDITTTGTCVPGVGGDGVDLSDFSCYLSEWSQGCP